MKMLTLSNLKPRIKRKPRKRVGRGLGSGHGTYAGRGIKGQKARSGGNIRPGFEGGRMPFIRQLPKMRGFKSIYPKGQALSLAKLAKAFAEDQEITPKVLLARGMIKTTAIPVKILGGGPESLKRLKFKNIKFSAAAKAAVEKAGGQVDV